MKSHRHGRRALTGPLGGHPPPPSRRQRLRAGRLDSFAALAGGASHELSNVLATVSMSVECLRGLRQAAPAQCSAALAALDETARRGLEVVRQLEELACGAECRALRFQARYLISDVQKLMISVSPAALVVLADYPPDLWLLEGDPLLVHQLLLVMLIAAGDAVASVGTISLAARNQRLDGGGGAGAARERAPGPYLVFEVTASPAEPAAVNANVTGSPLPERRISAPRPRPLTSAAVDEAVRAVGGFSELAAARRPLRPPRGRRA